VPPGDPRTTGAEARIEQAEARIEQAEARTEQAEARTEQAKTRTEQAETRTEQAETRAEEAKARTERAEVNTANAARQSDEAVRNSEVRYRRLFEAARDGILILETDSGQISDVNPFLIELLGFPRESLVGIPIWELGSFRDIVANKAMFDHLRKEGYVRYDHLPLETRDGRKIAVEFVSNVYTAGDRNVIQCNVRDITDRKRLQDEIRGQKEELERCVGERTAQLSAANEELQAFSYSVSHDLRRPLRHVLGFVELLRVGAGPTLSEPNLELLTTITAAANRMGKLIDDLLSLSRVGQSELETAKVDLYQLVNEVVADFEPELRERQVVWNVHPMPCVRADPSLMRLALVNLISNAIKFTGKCARATIEIGAAPGPPGETVIFVRDNGAGFDPRYAAKLFGAFQRLHPAEEFEGTGIGLANVQRIVRRHGGRIWAESVEGQGATFYFSVPDNPPPAEPKSAPPPP
jgi:PAS domain S-box-containing protein